MPIPLKQSTSVVVNFGPFVDKADGVTLESGLVTALDHVTTGIMLSKNGGAKAVRNGTPTASVYDSGDYRVTLNTTDTNTLGHLRLSYYDAATCVPVWLDCVVLPANVYDSLYSTDKLQVHVDEMTAGIITAAVIATNAIDDDALATDAVTAIQSGLATAAALATVDDFIDSEVAAILAAVDTEVAAIKAKTDNLPAAPAATGDIPSTAGISAAVWNSVLSGYTTAGTAGKAMSDILEDTAAMPTAAGIADAVWDEAKSGHVAAGSFGEEVQAHALTSDLSTLATAAALDTVDNLVDDLESRLTSARAGYLDNLSGGAVATASTLSLVYGIADDILSSTGATLETLVLGVKATVDDILVDTAAMPTAAGIADAVLDEAMSGHTTAGTLGKTVADILEDTGTTIPAQISSENAGIVGDINDVYVALGGATFDTSTDSLEAIRNRGDAAWTGGGAAPTVGEIADAVWDEAKAGHVAAGSFGEEVQAHALTSDLSTLATAAALDTVDNLVDDLESRLTSTRAGYLDNLSGGAVATAAALATVDGIVDDILVDTAAIPTAAGIADAVWDEAKAGHVAAGSFGEEVQAHALTSDLSTLATAAALATVDGIVDDILVDTAAMPTAAGIADAVWDEAKSGHVAAGSFGEEVQAHALTSDLSTLATAAALDTVDNLVDDLESRLTSTRAGYLDNLSGGAVATAAALATVDGIVDDILVDTAAMPTAAGIADAVWDEAIAGHVAAGSFGEEVQAHALTSDLSTLATAAALDTVDNLVDDLESRLTATRAGYLDNLSGGAVATAAALATVDSVVDAILDDTSVMPTAGTIADAVWDEAIAGHVAAGSTGESLSDAGASGAPPTVNEITDGVWDSLTSGLTAVGSIGKHLVDNINTTIGSRLSSASYSVPPTAADIADQVWDEAIAGHAAAGSTGAALSAKPTAVQIADQVWDEVLSGHATAGSTGAALAAATAAGDPWGVAIPGAYAAGTAGYIVGNRLDANVSDTCSGMGLITFTYTLTNTVDDEPIEDVEIVVTDDLAGTNMVAYGITDASGEVVFHLDAGTYYLWRQKSGWNFTNPDTEVVA